MPITDADNQKNTRLHPADAVAFFDALNNPPPPTDKLVAAARRYHSIVQENASWQAPTVLFMTANSGSSST